MSGKTKLALITLSATVMAACSSAPGSAPGAEGPRPATQASWWSTRPACEVPLPTEKRTQWSPPEQAKVSTMWPIGGKNEQGLIPFAQLEGAYRGLSTWNVTTGEQKRLHDFSEKGGAYGAFDGRYIIEKYFPQGFAAGQHFTINIHDTKTGALWEAGTNKPATPDGVIPVTPLESFGIRNGFAWWTTGVDRTTTEIRVADLANKTIQLAATGPYSSARFYLDGLMLNRLSEGDQGWREFVSFSGEKKPLPPAAKAAAKHQWTSVGPRGDVVYLDEDWTEIYYIAPGDEKSHLIWQQPIEKKVQYIPTLGDSGMLLRTMDPGIYYFDMTNGIYTKLLNGIGGEMLGHSVVSQVFLSSNAPKGAPGPRDFQFLDLPPGSLGTCRSTPAPLTPTTRAPITPTQEPPPPGTA